MAVYLLLHKSVQVRAASPCRCECSAHAWLGLYDARRICAIEQVEGEEEEGEEEEGEEEEGEESSELDSSGDEHPAKKEERSKVVIASRV